MNENDWRPIGYCPKCGEHTLSSHKHWDDGSSSMTPYARCSNCNQGFYILDLDADEDYYGDQMAEEART